MGLQATHPGLAQVRPSESWLVRHRAVIIRHAFINFFLLTILLPLLWVLLLSIKSLPDSMSGRLWPRQFDFTHYAYVFQKIDTLPVNLFNSIYVTAATVAITVFCAVLAGYALVHLKPRGGPFIIALLIASLYFPTRVVSIITIYGIQDFLGLINSTSGLILPYITLNLAVSVLIMRSVFQLVPHELMDAAHIDGAGVWRTLWMVGLPRAQRSRRGHHHRQFRDRLGRVSAVHDADQRPGRAHHAGGARGGAGRHGPVGLAAHRRGLRDRGHARHHRVRFAQRLFFKGLMEGMLKA